MPQWLQLCGRFLVTYYVSKWYLQLWRRHLVRALSRRFQLFDADELSGALRSRHLHPRGSEPAVPDLPGWQPVPEQLNGANCNEHGRVLAPCHCLPSRLHMSPKLATSQVHKWHLLIKVAAWPSYQFNLILLS